MKKYFTLSIVALFLLIPCYSAEVIPNAVNYQFLCSTERPGEEITCTYIFYNYAGTALATRTLEANDPDNYLDIPHNAPKASKAIITERTFGDKLKEYPCKLTFIGQGNTQVASFHYNPKDNGIFGTTPGGKDICPCTEPNDTMTKWASTLGLNLTCFDEDDFQEERKKHIPDDSKCLIQ